MPLKYYRRSKLIEKHNLIKHDNKNILLANPYQNLWIVIRKEIRNVWDSHLFPLTILWKIYFYLVKFGKFISSWQKKKRKREKFISFLFLIAWNLLPYSFFCIRTFFIFLLFPVFRGPHFHCLYFWFIQTIQDVCKLRRFSDKRFLSCPFELALILSLTSTHSWRKLKVYTL